MERQLGGPADDLCCLARVLQAGQLDDDAVLAGAREGRLGHAEGVDPSAQHLERAIGGLGVGLDPIGVLVSRTIWVPPRRSRPSLAELVSARASEPATTTNAAIARHTAGLSVMGRRYVASRRRP